VLFLFFKLKIQSSKIIAMAEGGYDERTPLIPHTDETGDGDDDCKATPGGHTSMGSGPGAPGAESTPARRHTRMNTPRERPSFDELLPHTPGLSTTLTAETEL